MTLLICYGLRAVKRGNWRMDGLKSLGLAAAAAITLSGVAGAQERVEQGHEIARNWCSSCHLVEPGGASGSDAAPPLPAVAQDPSLSPDRLRSWLADPHPPMPNLSLTRDEVEALVAYIGSLRAQ
jgi:mono/diheme cytochrome c family protein